MDSQSTEERAEKVIIALTPEQLKDICASAAEIGAKEALKTYEQERKKEQGKRADRRLRNTKLLLRNYHMLKEHAENSVFGRTQMEESALDILESMMNLYDNEVIIESIKRSATRTAIIVSHSVYIIRICSSNQNTGGNKDGNYHNEAGGPREARKECQNSYGATAERVPKKCQNVRTDPSDCC